MVKKVITLLLILVFAFGMQAAFAAEKQSLPKVAILATGGTIAGQAASNTQMTGYVPGAIGVQTLINAVPAIQNYAQVSGEQVANIGSYDMNNEIWLKLANRVNELLASDDCDGVVITHGTDTLEETAYFLNLVVKSDKPVVLTGAMRPATAISADGPVNLLNAVRLAADPNAKGRGVMVALNDEINCARDVTKTNTTSVETFKSPELGYIGYFQNGTPIFYRATTKKHTVDTEFNLKGITELPRVDIVYTHVNDTRTFVDSAVASGAKGIVHAGSGDGSIYVETKAGLLDAVKKGVIVVRASRVGNGAVARVASDDKDGFVVSDTLNPQKARILLMLALTKTNDVKEIQRMFYEY